MSATRRFALAMALGPVGRFISGGRRSRDLWYASRLLSELTRKAALSLKAAGVTFVVPRAEVLQKLEDHLFFPDIVRPDNQPEWQGPVISNKIQCLVSADSGEEVRKLVDQAEKASRDFLATQLKRLESTNWFKAIEADRAAFRRQREAIPAGDFVEFYAAWTPVHEPAGENEHDSPVEAAFDRALELLAARKMARVFPSASYSEPGKPKSSLDPGRDSVLYEPDPSTDHLRLAKVRVRRQIRGIGTNERLDAVDLLRRHAWFWEFHAPDDGNSPASHGFGRSRRPFPSLPRVAADAWIEGASVAAPEVLAKVRDALEPLSRTRALNLFSSLSRNPGDTGEEPEKFPFPFDPSFLFEGGIEALYRETRQAGSHRFGGVRAGDLNTLLKALEKDGEKGEDTSVVGAAVQVLRKFSSANSAVQQLFQALGFPSSYYAMLSADGDSIGSLLKKLGERSLDQKRRLVCAMDTFAQRAWEDVTACSGVAFYVGGDELTAYLPVDRILEVSTRLTDTFDTAVREAEDEGLELPEGARPTLSIGVVVAHRKEDLRAVRRKAEEALQEAKRRRKQGGRPVGHLAIREDPAGGASRLVCGPVSDLVDRLNLWLEALSDVEQAGAGRVEARGGADIGSAEPTAGRQLSETAGSRELSLSLAHDLYHLYRLFEEDDASSTTPGADGRGTTGLDLARSMLALKTRRSGWKLSPALAARFDPERVRGWADVLAIRNEILLAARLNEVACQRRPPARAFDAARKVSRRRMS